MTHPVPREAMKESVAIVGRTGSGKSYAARGMIETLLADGERVLVIDPTGVHIETRHWSTAYRGPLAIHAAKHWDAEQREFASIERGLGRLPRRIPFGAIVAVCELRTVMPTHHLLDLGAVGAIEKIYGNYAVGRYGWVLDCIRALPEPIPYRGAQGLFNVPDELLAP